MKWEDDYPSIDPLRVMVISGHSFSVVAIGQRRRKLQNDILKLRDSSSCNRFIGNCARLGIHTATGYMLGHNDCRSFPAVRIAFHGDLHRPEVAYNQASAFRPSVGVDGFSELFRETRRRGNDQLVTKPSLAWHRTTRAI